MEAIRLKRKRTNQDGVTQVELRSLYEATSQSYKLELREKQNIYKGIIGGSAAAIVGAFLWSLVAKIIGYQVGWMAIVVGFLVGYGVRIMGKGVDMVFGAIGAILTLTGCFGGNILIVMYSASNQHGLQILTVITQMDITFLMNKIKNLFSPMDLLFYGLAIYEGFKYAIIHIEAEEKKR